MFLFLSTEPVYAQANSDKTESCVCLFSRSSLALNQFDYLFAHTLMLIYNLCMAISLLQLQGRKSVALKTVSVDFFCVG